MGEKEDTALSVKQSVRHKERAREAKADTTHPAMVNPATDMALSMALDTMEAREERVDTMALAMVDTTEAREERVDTMALAMVDTTEAREERADTRFLQSRLRHVDGENSLS